MTKEEIVYAAIRQIANTDKPERFAEINQTTFKVAMKVAELMQPSLPEGLDEAAEKYGIEQAHGDNDYIAWYHKYGFKAGAKWMAGQGVTCGGRIMKSSTGETYAESDYVPLDGKCGDKVIVQIRKKED